MHQKDFPIKWIELANLSVVWLDAQRPPNEREARRIAENFDPDAMDPLTVTLPNGNGIYHIIDGQTRRAALMQLWNDPHQRVPCRVLNAKTKKDAARIWSTMNSGHKSPSAIEKFLVDRTAGEAEATTIDRIVSGLGLKVAADFSDGVIAAVGALRTVYRKHGDAGLTWTLGTIRETWGKDREAYHGSIVQAFGDLFGKHTKVLDRNRLVRVTQKQYTPNRLLASAKTARDMFKGTVPSKVVELLEASYNNGLRNAPRLEA